MGSEQAALIRAPNKTRLSASCFPEAACRELRYGQGAVRTLCRELHGQGAAWTDLL